MAVSLDVLGPVQLRRDDQLLPTATHKARALLVLLALAGPAPRSRIASWLWPAVDEPSARRNLRRELARLREQGLEVISGSEVLALEAGVRCDAAAFAAAIDAGRFDEALTWWRGPPADGLLLDGTEAFDDWLRAERTRLHGLRDRALQAAAAADEARGDWAAALSRVEALLAADPLQEGRHRDAMRLLAAAGRREAAIAQYERCRELLSRELGLAPMAETEALRAAVLGDAFGAAPAPPHSAAVQRLFVGRHDALAALSRAWDEQRVMAIEGVAGVGKTALALRLAESAGAHAVVPCRAGDAAVPLASFTRALRGMAGGDLARAAMPAWAAAELARVLPELGPDPGPIQGDGPRQRFFEAGVAAWRALADGNFDTVVVDDWHLADPASRTLFSTVAGGGTRLVIVLRPELDDAAQAALQQLVDGGALHVPLAPLDEAPMLDWVRQVVGPDAPPALAAQLKRATGGHPFFVAEALRHWQQLGLIERWRGGGGDAAAADQVSLPMPASVHEAVLARMRRLGDGVRRMLEAAALASEPFAPLVLAGACALSEVETLAALDAALEAQLLREHDGGGYAFEHDLVRLAIDGALTPERRRLVHRRLALGAERAIGTLGHEGTQRALAGAEGAAAGYVALTPAEIARHWEAGGEPQRAVPHRIAAAEAACDLNELQLALQHWQQAIDDGPSPAERLRVLSQRWKVERRGQDRGAMARSIAELDHWRDQWRQATATAPLARRAAIEAAEMCSLISRSEEALARIEHVAAGDAADAPPDARVLRVRSQALNGLGRTDEGAAAAEAALAAGGLSPMEEGHVLHSLIYSHFLRSQPRPALQYAYRTAALWQGIGARVPQLAWAYSNIGLLHSALGEDDTALPAYERAFELAGELRMVEVQRQCTNNLACIHLARGEPRAAMAAVERVLAVGTRVSPDRVDVFLHDALLQAHAQLGELGQALDQAEIAYSGALTVSESMTRAECVSMALDVHTFLGDAEAAARLLALLDGYSLEGIEHFAVKLAFNRVRHALAFADAAEARRQLAPIGAVAAIEEPRDRVHAALCHAQVHLAEGEVDEALAWLDRHPAVPGTEVEVAAAIAATRLAARLDGAARGAADRAALESALESAIEGVDAWLADRRTPALTAVQLRLERRRAALALGHHPDATRLQAEHAVAIERLAASLAGRPREQALLRRRWG